MRLRSKTRRLSAIAVAFALAMTGMVATLSPTATYAAEGENVALASSGAVVTASGNEVTDGRWTFQMATDGDRESRWSSNYSDTAWLQVQLAEPTVVHHVNVLWEAACAASYKLQVSNDGSTWTDATGTISPTCPTSGYSVDTQTLNAATADEAWEYVRMQALDRTPIGGTKWGVSLFEFEVWNGEEPAPPTPPSGDVNLVPLPVQLTEHDSEPFVLDADTTIVASGAGLEVANLVAQELRDATGFDLPIAASGDTGVIKFVLDDSYESLPAPASWAESNDGSYPEGYDLATDEDAAVITAGAAHGLWNGSRTLLQLFPPLIFSDDTVYTQWTAPSVTIKDVPRYVHRGTQIDVARSFIEVDELKQIIDTLSSVKISRIHLHLADDQGWRIEITNEGRVEGDTIDYTRLHRIGGNLSMAETQPGKSFGYREEIGRNGYYSQDEYRDIVAYAAARQVTIVPEIDVPGHTGAMLHSIPELNTANTRPFKTVYGNTVEQNNGNVGESTLDVNNPQTWTALRHIFGQLAEMTPGPYIHVGGDETHATPHADFQAFVRQVIGVVRETGKSAIGWNEFADAGLSEGDVVQYWVGGTARTYQAIQDGAKVVVSASNRAYLDMKYSSSTPIGLTWAGMGDLDHYYSWNPLTVIRPPSSDLPAVEEKDLIGMEGPMWSETIRRGTQNEFMMFPRAISHAEIGWTPQAQRDLTSFIERMEPMGARLLARDTNFYDSPKVTWDTAAAGVAAKAAPGQSMLVQPATIAAPGTKVSADGRSIAVDTVADADGVSASELTAPLTATVDFGDGSDPVPATFEPVQERTSLHAGSRYLVGATHSYGSAGNFDATVTFSDGRVVTGQVTVEAGYTIPQPWAPDVCVAPGAEILNADLTVQDNSRLVADLSGFTPNSLVTIQFSPEAIEAAGPTDTKADDPSIQGRYMTDAEGTAHLTMPVVYQTVAGKYLFRVTDVDGRFVEQLVTVDSQTQPLSGLPITAESATASSQALSETAPNGRPIAIIDGNRSTFWHSNWSPAEPLPFTINVDLGESYDLTSMTWVPRQNNVNGQVSDFTISFSTDNTTWSDPVAMELPAGTGATTFEFDNTVRYVRIVITENHSTENQFATIGELEFRGLEPGQSEPEAPADPVPAVWEAPASCGPDETGPAVLPIDDVAVETGAAVSVTVSATDSSVPLTYEASGLPAGLDIDEATGDISGAPTTAGTYPVTVTVTDAEGNSTEVTFTIVVTDRVVEDNTAPTITPIAGVSGKVGAALSIQVQATDESLPLGYSATGLPAGVVINAETGLIAGTPTAAGTFPVVVTVTDAEGNDASVSFSITVEAADTTPTPTPTPPVAEKFQRTVPYTTPGAHTHNGRQWMTTCEPYSQTERCRTEIWASTVQRTGNTFTIERGWAFNNLTYLPFMKREQWAGNPLAQTGFFTGTDQAKWRTECDTEATGSNGCRSYRLTTVYVANPKASGGYTFGQENKWVFNNIVLFGNYTR